ncbi:MAG TPA: HAD family hydrolase [Gaiellaceae bacterium]|nr:HAD family hydrolase [Gaiellaceae bacterium]
MARKVIFWDFDGTLAHRPGMWRGCLVETLDEHEPGHGIDPENLRPFLRTGFPWDSPDVPHPELTDPDAWWKHVQLMLAAAYEGVGIESGRAAELAGRVRDRYVDPARVWELFPDTAPVLAHLRSEGWHHLVLSNHVPELPAIAEGLGLTPLVDHIVTSAATGYEKPHPEAFRLALELCGAPNEVWMVGDNPAADVAGAEAAGIPAVLVRTQHEPTSRSASDLHEAAEIITGVPIGRRRPADSPAKPAAATPHPHP